MMTTPNFTGRWKADIGRSTFLSPAPKAITATIEHTSEAIRIVMASTRADNTQSKAELSCRTTGEEGSTKLNGNPIRGKASWLANELIIESRLQAGDREIYLKDCWSLAEDGKTLTMAHRDDALAGQISVFERIG